MKRATRTKPIPVRLDNPTIERLDRAAGRLSSNRAAMMRLAISQLLPMVEAGHLILKEVQN